MGSILKHERMNQEISIAKMASDLHLNPSTIVSIEDAKHQVRFMTIYKILTYLKMDPVLFIKRLEK